MKTIESHYPEWIAKALTQGRKEPLIECIMGEKRDKKIFELARAIAFKGKLSVEEWAKSEPENLHMLVKLAVCEHEDLRVSALDAFEKLARQGMDISEYADILIHAKNVEVNRVAVILANLAANGFLIEQCVNWVAHRIWNGTVQGFSFDPLTNAMLTNEKHIKRIIAAVLDSSAISSETKERIIGNAVSAGLKCEIMTEYVLRNDKCKSDPRITALSPEELNARMDRISRMMSVYSNAVSPPPNQISDWVANAPENLQLLMALATCEHYLIKRDIWPILNIIAREGKIDLSDVPEIFWLMQHAKSDQDLVQISRIIAGITANTKNIFAAVDCLIEIHRRADREKEGICTNIEAAAARCNNHANKMILTALLDALHDRSFTRKEEIFDTLIGNAAKDPETGRMIVGFLVQGTQIGDTGQKSKCIWRLYSLKETCNIELTAILQMAIEIAFEERTFTLGHATNILHKVIKEGNKAELEIIVAGIKRHLETKKFMKETEENSKGYEYAITKMSGIMAEIQLKFDTADACKGKEGATL